MIEYLIGFAYVVIFFVIGLVVGGQIMNYYFANRFEKAAEQCMKEDSVAPLVDELNEML